MLNQRIRLLELLAVAPTPFEKILEAFKAQRAHYVVIQIIEPALNAGFIYKAGENYDLTDMARDLLAQATAEVAPDPVPESKPALQTSVAGPIRTRRMDGVYDGAELRNASPRAGAYDAYRLPSRGGSV